MRGKERHISTVSDRVFGEGMSKPVARIGTVPYLNALPLVLPLEKNTVHSKYEFEITKAPPSRLVKLLQTACLDVALLSVVEAMKDKRIRVISGICICSHGATRTTQIYYKGEPSQIKTLALDAESCTSNLLARIILHERYGIKPECKVVFDVCEKTLDEYDAFVAIGDKNFRLLRTGLPHIDLGEAWCELTGLPIVYAVWCIAPHFKDRDIIDVLRVSCKLGLQMLDEVIPRVARTRDIPMEELTSYFHKNVDYKLDVEEKKGIAKLFELGHKIDLLPPPRLIEYYFG